MKKLFLICALIFLGAASLHAAQIPNCWDDDNSDEPRFVDGSFIVSLNTKSITKSELLKLLDQVDGKHIRAKRYPLIFDDLVIIVVEAVDYGVGEYKLSRAELKKAVNEELQPISDTRGVSISCNTIARPFGR